MSQDIAGKEESVDRARGKTGPSLSVGGVAEWCQGTQPTILPTPPKQGQMVKGRTCQNKELGFDPPGNEEAEGF